jgi:hypothetical protein
MARGTKLARNENTRKPAEGAKHHRKYEQTQPQKDEPLVKWAAVTARATIWLAAVTVALVVVTAGLSLIAYWQYGVLKSTDDVTREFNRAFVFLEDISEKQTSNGNQKSDWHFVPNIKNNGNTQTRDAVALVACDKAAIKELFDGKNNTGKPRVIGPKQKIGAGLCSWDADTLEREQNIPHYIGGVIRYDDVFDGKHVTKFCREVRILADPRPIGAPLQYSTSLCPETLDCADKECDRK